MTNDRCYSRMTLFRLIQFSLQDFRGRGEGRGEWLVPGSQISSEMTLFSLYPAQCRNKNWSQSPSTYITNRSADLAGFTCPCFARWQWTLTSKHWWLSEVQRSCILTRYPSPQGILLQLLKLWCSKRHLLVVFLCFLLTQLPVLTARSSCCFGLSISIIASVFPSVS